VINSNARLHIRLVNCQMRLLDGEPMTLLRPTMTHVRVHANERKLQTFEVHVGVRNTRNCIGSAAADVPEDVTSKNFPR
jgi:hypothetical protein